MKKVVVLLFFTGIISSLFAQNYEIKGRVTDSLTGEPLFGSVIHIKALNMGATTDFDGFYSIKGVPEGTHELLFVIIGYRSKKITVTITKNQPTVILNIPLTENLEVLSELVIVEKHRPSMVAAERIPTRAFMSGVTVGGAINPSIRANEEYTLFKENKFTSAADNPLSTFSVDVDRAGYGIVRSYIKNDEELPPVDAVRVEEMINYFNYNYAEPGSKEAVSINTTLTKSPWSNNLLLKIGLKTKAIDVSKAPKGNYVFLIDVSGSMQDANKLPWVKQSLNMLLEQMRPTDRIAIVVYAGASGLVLPSTPGSEKEKIIQAINNLSAGGSTAGAAGIQLAYKIAEENFIKKGNNRIILCTDGDFNVGVTNNSELERLVAEKKKVGVYLTVLGFGMGNYKDNRMELLADKGNGNYGYIDNLDEARKILVKEMGSTLVTVAGDVKLQIEFNPLLVKEYRLIGYENRLLDKEDFNNDSIDAGDMGAGHTVTAIYEIVPGVASANADEMKYQQVSTTKAAGSDELVTIKFRYKKPGTNKSRLQTETVKNNPVEFLASGDDMRCATLVAAFGMLLRNSAFKGAMNYDSLRNMAVEILGNTTDPEKKELLALIKNARVLYLESHPELAAAEENYEDDYTEFDDEE